MTETVVTLHGLGRTSKMMCQIVPILKQQKYEVENIDYPSKRYPIEQLVESYLKPILDKHRDAEKIHFVTHSMGGILVRYYLNHFQLENLGYIVMLGPPNQGSELAQFLQTNWLTKHFFKWYFGPAGQQLGIDENSIPLQLDKVDASIGIITGDRNYNPLFRLIMPSPSDGKVSVERAKLDEMQDFRVVSCGHTFITHDKHVISQILHFLRLGTFDKK